MWALSSKCLFIAMLNPERLHAAHCVFCKEELIPNCVSVLFSDLVISTLEYTFTIELQALNTKHR